MKTNLGVLKTFKNFQNSLNVEVIYLYTASRDIYFSFVQLNLEKIIKVISIFTVTKCKNKLQKLWGK